MLLCPTRASQQFHVVTYMDNTIPGVNPATQRSGRPIKSISQVRWVVLCVHTSSSRYEGLCVMRGAMIACTSLV